MAGDAVELRRAVSTLRWTARVLGAVIVVFSLVMFVGESLESRSRGSSLDAGAVAGLSLMGLYLFGLLVAWWRERLGAAMGAAGLGGVFVFVAVREGTRWVLNPFLLGFWIPLLLFLAAAWFEARARRPAGLPADRGASP